MSALVHLGSPITAGRLFSAVRHSFICQSTPYRTGPGQCWMASRSSYGDLCVPKSSPAW